MSFSWLFPRTILFFVATRPDTRPVLLNVDNEKDSRGQHRQPESSGDGNPAQGNLSTPVSSLTGKIKNRPSLIAGDRTLKKQLQALVDSAALAKNTLHSRRKAIVEVPRKT
jgi:hypothetical protein